MRDRDLQRPEHVGHGADQRRIDLPAVAALPELRARRGKVIGHVLRQVAERRVGRQPRDRVGDRGRGAEVHLRDGRAEPARPRSGPLVAPAGAEHRRGSGVDRASECSGHTDILHRMLSTEQPRQPRRGDRVPQVLTAPRMLTGDETMTDGVVVIGDTTVEWAGPAAELPAQYASLPAASYPGSTILPGLID